MAGMEPMVRHPSRILVIVALFVAGCGSPAGSPAASATLVVAASPSPAPSAVSSPAAASQQVRTAIEVTVGGLPIIVNCEGEDTGSPTIVLMHGNDAGENQFRLVKAGLLKLSRVCEYARPGTGRTQEPARLPRPITDVVAEAHEVLAQAKIGPQVFLLGTSQGGALAFMYAQAYPDEVAGFVSINPVPPYEQWIAEVSKVETPEEVATIEEPDYRGENPEQIDNRPTSSMLTDPLPDSMPYAMMFDEDCGGDTTFCDRVFEPLGAITERLSQVGSGGRFVPVPGAGHNIEQSNPREVTRVVDEVWSEATS